MAGKIEDKVAHYKKLTKAALEKVGFVPGLGEKEQKTAEDFIEMAKNYFADAQHFGEKGELMDALAAYSYAHAWLDAGVRAGWLDAKGDDKLFTLP